jgi:hypothetical protein
MSGYDGRWLHITLSKAHYRLTARKLPQGRILREGDAGFKPEKRYSEVLGGEGVLLSPHVTI